MRKETARTRMTEKKFSVKTRGRKRDSKFDATRGKNCLNRIGSRAGHGTNPANCCHNQLLNDLGAPPNGKVQKGLKGNRRHATPKKQGNSSEIKKNTEEAEKRREKNCGKKGGGKRWNLTTAGTKGSHTLKNDWEGNRPKAGAMAAVEGEGIIAAGNYKKGNLWGQ